MTVDRPKLCNLDWFKDMYVKIYNVINVENVLPNPCEITILYPEDVEVKNGTVLGLAWRSSKTLWFSKQPPDYITFAHELIHLIEKDAELEEFYSYNLASFAVLLAEKDITPPTNIIRLYDAGIDDVLEALRNAYGYNFSGLEDYFMTIGVIPSFIIFDVENGNVKLKIDPRYDEKVIIMNTINELIAGIEYDKYVFDAVMRILKTVKKKEVRK